MKDNNKRYSHWNYRVFKENTHGEDFLTIREVYYRNDKPVSYSSDPQFPSGENLVELKENFYLMKNAFEKEILTEGDFK